MVQKPSIVKSSILVNKLLLLWLLLLLQYYYYYDIYYVKHKKMFGLPLVLLCIKATKKQHMSVWRPYFCALIKRLT